MRSICIAIRYIKAVRVPALAAPKTKQVLEASSSRARGRLAVPEGGGKIAPAAVVVHSLPGGGAMVPASQLRAGAAIRHEGQIYRVLAADYRGGQGKMGGVAHVRLKNLATGAVWEHSFRADLKLEDLPVEKQTMEYLYADGDQCYFMNPDTYEQVGIASSVIGEQARFLQPQMRLLRRTSSKTAPSRRRSWKMASRSWCRSLSRQEI